MPQACCPKMTNHPYMDHRQDAAPDVSVSPPNNLERSASNFLTEWATGRQEMSEIKNLPWTPHGVDGHHETRVQGPRASPTHDCTRLLVGGTPKSRRGVARAGVLWLAMPPAPRCHGAMVWGIGILKLVLSLVHPEEGGERERQRGKHAPAEEQASTERRARG